MPENMQDRIKNQQEQRVAAMRATLKDEMIIIRDALRTPSGEALFGALVKRFDHEEILVAGSPDLTGERQGEKNVINHIRRLLRNEEKLDAPTNTNE